MHRAFDPTLYIVGVRPLLRVQRTWCVERLDEKSALRSYFSGERLAPPNLARLVERRRSLRPQRQGFEQFAHAVGGGEALGGGVQGGGVAGVGGGEAGEPEREAKPMEELALGERAPGAGAGSPGGGYQAGEVDVGGEVGGAGGAQRGRGLAVFERLERVAADVGGAAVVQDQRGAALGDEAVGKDRNPGVGGFATFADGAYRAIAGKIGM